MLTENEVGKLLDISDVYNIVADLHQTFTEAEQSLKNISNHDFLSGMLMLPSVALARVDGTTSLFEELSLNKKARRFSKGGFFLQQDPVVKMVNLLQTSFGQWETKFFEGLSKILKVVVPEITGGSITDEHKQGNDIFLSVMNSSYILIKLLETFFLPEGEEITNKRRISELEHKAIVTIGDQLQLSNIPSFKSFIKTFEVK